MMISQQRLAQSERRPTAIIIRTHARHAARMKRRTPRITLEQNFCEMTMREDALFTPNLRRTRKAMKERQHAQRIRTRERDLDIALQSLTLRRQSFAHLILVYLRDLHRATHSHPRGE